MPVYKRVRSNSRSEMNSKAGFVPDPMKNILIHKTGYQKKNQTVVFTACYKNARDSHGPPVLSACVRYCLIQARYQFSILFFFLDSENDSTHQLTFYKDDSLPVLLWSDCQVPPIHKYVATLEWQQNLLLTNIFPSPIPRKYYCFHPPKFVQLGSIF